MVTKSSTPAPYVPGAPLTYTVTVSNAGPSDVTNARVQDALPPPLAGFSWTCTPTAPASCGTPSGSGDIDALVSLPAGSHVTLQRHRHGAGGDHGDVAQQRDGDAAAGDHRSGAG